MAAARLVVALALLGWAGAALACPVPPPGARPPSAVAEEQTDIVWLLRFHEMNLALRREKPDTFVVGDSILEGWAAEASWAPFARQYRAVNLGVGYDRTQNVIWRLQSAHLKLHQPRLLLLMIGTNNLANGHSPEVTAQGVGAIVDLVRRMSPATRIVVLGLLPRAERADDPLRRAVVETNRLLAACDNGQTVFFRDIAAGFVAPNGRIPANLLPDFLHPKAEGYALMARNVEAVLKELAPR